jgi:hypothetical protein
MKFTTSDIPRTKPFYEGTFPIAWLMKVAPNRILDMNTQFSWQVTNL